MKPANRLRLRGLLLAAGLSFIIGGPLWVQILGGSFSPVARTWRMYKLVGLKTCQAVYTRHHPDGRTERLDRFAVLGVAHPNLHQRYRMGTPREIRHHGRDLCRALDGGSTAIHVRASCPSLSGWHEVFDGTEDICK